MSGEHKTGILCTRTTHYFLETYRAATLGGAVEAAANIERSSHFSSSGDFSRIPVDVIEIARRKGIDIEFCARGTGRSEAEFARNRRPANKEEKTGELFTVSNDYISRISDAGTRFRKRFSLAHEIGHSLFFSGRKHRIGLLDKDELQAEEYICNLFAMALLMPREPLRTLCAWGRNAKSEDILWGLDLAARRFQVSIEALLSRLAKVRTESRSALVVCLRRRPNKRTGSDICLRVNQWLRIGPGKSLWTFQNRSAEHMRFCSALRLFESWANSLKNGLDPHGGRYVLSVSGGLIRQDKPPLPNFREEVEVSFYEHGKWAKRSTAMCISTSLYAAPHWSPDDAFVISVLMPT